MGAAAFLLLAGMVHIAFRTERERARSNLRTQVTSQAVSILTHLEAELAANVFLANGLAAYIVAVGEVREENLSVALKTLYEAGHHVRNIGLAPNSRLSHVYPVEGNQNAIGLYYPELPEQWPAVKRAIDSKSTVLAGPVALMQGGSGLISRTPVLLEDGSYWGALSVVLNTDDLFTATGLRTEANGVRFAMRGRDGSGRSGDIFLGDADVFEHAPVELTLSVPGGTWLMAAQPAGGWGSAGTAWLLGEIVAGALSGLLAGLVYFYQRGMSRVGASERRLRLFLETTRMA